MEKLVLCAVYSDALWCSENSAWINIKGRVVFRSDAATLGDWDKVT